MIECETKLRELSKFVLELANFEEYLYSKFEDDLSLEIRENMSITGTQSYKEVVQLALRVEKLTCERMSRSNFQKRKGFSSFWDSLRRRVRAQILLETFLGQALVLLVLLSLFETLLHPSLVLHYRVLLSRADKLLGYKSA